jgi:heat-inducible transcriptional repressor
MSVELLSDRERRVLEAVIRSYVETAEPAGSRTVSKRFLLGISPATVRNTMADLEEKGFLFHPHTSAGRVPTDRAYRYYVDTLMRPMRLTAAQNRQLLKELGGGDGAAGIERLVRRAAQVLGLITGELGVAIAPRLEEATLEKLEMVSLSSEKVLLVLTLGNGLVRTIYVDLTAAVPPETLVALTMVLNERLAGQRLSEIRKTLPERLRDSVPTDDPQAVELLNIFIQSGEDLFEWEAAGEEVLLGRTSVLAAQPEFASGSSLKSLIELTERRDLLANVLGARERATVQITIGEEHLQPELSPFTLVTSEYQVGNLVGVIGVIGPTRMPYERVVSIVERTSALVSELVTGSRPGAPRAGGGA